MCLLEKVSPHSEQSTSLPFPLMNTKFIAIQSCRCLEGFVASRLKAKEAVFVRRTCEQMTFQRRGEAVVKLYPTYMARWGFGRNLSFANRFYRRIYGQMLFHIVGWTKLLPTFMALCRLL